MEAFDGGFLNVRLIRSTWPSVQGWLGFVRLCLIPLASQIMSKPIGRVDGVPVPALLGELDAVIGKNRVELVWRGLEHVLQEPPRRLSVSRCHELSDGEPGCPVDADKQV